MLHTLIISVYTCMYISGQLDLDSTVCPVSFMKQYSCWQQSTYLEVIHQLFLYPPLYPVLRSCILLRPCLYHQSELCIPGTSQFYQWGIVLSQQGSSQFYLGGIELCIPGTSQFCHWGIELCIPGTSQFYHWGQSCIYQEPVSFITGGQSCAHQEPISFITGGQTQIVLSQPGSSQFYHWGIDIVICTRDQMVLLLGDSIVSTREQSVLSLGDSIVSTREQSVLSLKSIVFSTRVQSVLSLGIQLSTTGTSQFYHCGPYQGPVSFIIGGIHLSEHNLPISLMMGV